MECQYHIVFTPKYHRKIIYGALRTEIEKYYENYVSEKKWKS